MAVDINAQMTTTATEGMFDNLVHQYTTIITYNDFYQEVFKFRLQPFLKVALLLICLPLLQKLKSQLIKRKQSH